MAEDKKQSIFQKIIEAGSAVLDNQILKAKSQILNSDIDDDFLYSKAIIQDPNYSTHAQGWIDKPYRIQNAHLKQMSTQDSVVAAVIQTRQNQIASHSKLVRAKSERGFMITLRDEDKILADLKAEILEELKAKQQVVKAESSEGDLGGNTDESSMEGSAIDGLDFVDDSDDAAESFNWELERRARERLNREYAKDRRAVEEYILNCGKVDQRAFPTKRWTFDGALRAWSRDSLTYDLYATEIVPDGVGKPHHWFPVDGGTIKYASEQLKNYKDLAETFVNMDILYPENLEVAAEKQKVIDLKPELLEKDMYKYVQVIRGRVERAYTADELKIGIRNITTDIYVNGYGISELELLVSMVTGHLNAEFYNQAYFTQGFSAKGILHIKAAIPRRKLESVRQEWQYMIKGARNAFQTPIFAGLDDLKWIPLTQNHNDIGFEGWMRYLTTMICSIYQIDPAELGIYFKSEGSGGSLSSGDSPDKKISQSKDKGLYPFLRHVENYINEGIIKPFDSRFVLKFTGMADETKSEMVDRQQKEVQFKKTVNEIRAEDGLPALPGMDDFIMSPVYAQWYMQYSEKAQQLGAQNQQMMANQSPVPEDDNSQPEEIAPDADVYDNAAGDVIVPSEESQVQKSLRKKPLVIEYYKLEK